MSLQIRMFGPMTDKKKELHNLFTNLGYPIYMDFVNGGNQNWMHTNKETSFFYFIDGTVHQQWVWPCTDERPDLQITPSQDLFTDGGDVYIEWMENLLNGNVYPYKYAAPPEAQLMELPVFDHYPGLKEYELETCLVNDYMFYQVTKPHVDIPYTTVVRGFEKNGHKRFFTNLFICNSWGVANADIQFLHKAWKWLEMDDEMDLDALMKEATEACKYPTMETEPEVWRNDLKSVLQIFNKRTGF